MKPRLYLLAIAIAIASTVPRHAQAQTFQLPTQGTLSSGYGMRWGRMHKGIDIAAPIGTPIVASAGGTVTYARWNPGGYGNLVEIKHPDGSVTLYAHAARILVREGLEVYQNEAIALVGSTGRSTGPHLHFEIHLPGKGAVNPLAMISKPDQSSGLNREQPNL